MPAILIDPAATVPADPVMGIVLHEECPVIHAKCEHEPAAAVGEGAGGSIPEVVAGYLQVMGFEELDEFFLDG